MIDLKPLDLISRKWLLDVVENIIEWDTERDRNRAIHQVRELTPAVDAVPVVHGEWIEYGEPNSLGEYEPWYWTCSECGAVGLDVFNYCPKCGAYMDGQRKEDDNNG